MHYTFASMLISGIDVLDLLIYLKFQEECVSTRYGPNEHS